VYYRARALEFIGRAEDALDDTLEAHFRFVAERYFRLAVVETLRHGMNRGIVMGTA